MVSSVTSLTLACKKGLHEANYSTRAVKVNRIMKIYIFKNRIVSIIRSMSMTTARQKVLAYLKKNRAVSAAQIGRALNMSAANARHHLTVLCSDGRAQQVGMTRRAGRGRPVKLYGLSENLLGNNLARLSSSVLEAWLKGLSSVEWENALRALSRTLISQMGPASSNLPMMKRLALVVEKLNGLNYQARWEASAEGPRLLFAHCPYAAIIANHPELCTMDAALLEELMGQPARQTAKIGEAESPICAFKIV